MNPSNSAACHHSPLVDDPLESKVGWLSPADPLYLLLTPSTSCWPSPPPDDPFKGHPWLVPLHLLMTPSKVTPGWYLSTSRWPLQRSPLAGTLHLLMTPSKVTPGWHPPPPDDPFRGHLLLTPSDGQDRVFKMGDHTSFFSLLWASNHYGESRRTTLQAPSSTWGSPLHQLSWHPATAAHALLGCLLPLETCPSPISRGKPSLKPSLKPSPRPSLGPCLRPSPRSNLRSSPRLSFLLLPLAVSPFHPIYCPPLYYML